MITRVLIVDDHPAVREGLALRISSQPDLEVCGEAADEAEALELLAAARPDVAVVDIQLKHGDGLQLVRRIKARSSSIGILVWSIFSDKAYAERALNAGALGFINKQQATDKVVGAIRCVREGRLYLGEETAQRLLTRSVVGRPGRGQSPIHSLSDRELEVFRLIGDGLSTNQVARRLHISPHTVETHRERIKEKLGLTTAGELNYAAILWVLQGE